jgi:hypothetical protein
MACSTEVHQLLGTCGTSTSPVWLYTSRLYFTANLRWRFTFAQTTEMCCMALLLCDAQEVQTLKATIRDQSAAARRQEAALADNNARLRQLQVRANAAQQQH